MPKEVLAVCTGNVCRSPMVEYLLRHRLADQPEWLFGSAGVFAGEGAQASPESVAVLKEWGIDASGHRSRGLTRELVDAADYILVMTRGHASAILAQWPDCAERVHLLTSFGLAKEPAEVDDPIGCSLSVYRQVRDQIDAAVSDFILYLAEHEHMAGPEKEKPGKD
jgi:protein-tyrosine-phosphatase